MGLGPCMESACYWTGSEACGDVSCGVESDDGYVWRVEEHPWSCSGVETYFPVDAYGRNIFENVLQAA